ncbi:hypothetical protein Tco_1409471 [Tanacetum coccineum]
MWVNEIKYELQEIYGIGNLVDGADSDGNDPDKECVICLSEPQIYQNRGTLQSFLNVTSFYMAEFESEYSGTVR